MNEKINLIFKTYSGSLLYGTNSEKSDIDFKGVFLPEKRDLLLGKPAKTVTKSTASDHVRNTKDDVDESYYSLHYFLELLAKGETNCLDLFFANTNKSAVVLSTPIWEELTQNADKLITKNIDKYLGFCRSQAFKYSFKGEKLANYKKFHQFLTENMKVKNVHGTYITLEEALIKSFEIIDYTNPKPLIKNNVEIGKRYKQRWKDKIFGDHCYIIIANNKEKQLMISDVKFQFTEDVKDVRSKVNRVIESYGERSNIAANAEGADYKALSHSIRVLFQAEQLINEGKITFPLNKEKVDFIKSVKYGTTKLSFEEIVDYINERMDYISNELLPKSTLRESADYKWIDKFILKQYE